MGVLDGAGNVRVVQATGLASGTGNGFGGKGTGPISPSLTENSWNKETFEEYKLIGHLFLHQPQIIITYGKEEDT